MYQQNPPTTTGEDLVILLDERGRPCGTADRDSVHGTDTPLHLAFSCYLFDDAGRVLLTRRALTKRTWAGVWTNACCGHPRPDEAPVDAVRRRAYEELGVTIADLRLVLPDFAYRATDASGVVEHEVCPVWVGVIDPESTEPHPGEVADLSWVDWPGLVDTARLAPILLSPWSVLQIPLLDEALRSKDGAA